MARIRDLKFVNLLSHHAAVQLLIMIPVYGDVDVMNDDQVVMVHCLEEVEKEV